LSQLFDSLRRGRPGPEGASSRRRAAQGDAVLATLGYTAKRRSRVTTPLVIGGAVLLALGGWMAWDLIGGPRDAPAVPETRATPLPAPARGSDTPTAPVTDRPASTPEPPALSVPPPVAPEVRTAPEPAAAAERASPRRPEVRPPSRAASPGAARIAGTEPPSPQPPAESAPAAPDPMSLALYYHRAGDFERALVQYRAILEQNELNALAHNNLGMLYQQRNLLDEAAREFQRAVLIDPRYLLARNNHGAVLLRQDRVDAAAAEFRAVLAQDPRNADALVNLALAEKASGRPEQAKASLLRALGLAPDHAGAHYNLAVLHDETGEIARAVEHYAHFLEKAGPDYADRAPQVRARMDALAKR
jgi:Tfp pilus assembly protein PilF